MNREYETARVEDRGEGLLLLTLNRPEVANAMNTQMGRDLLSFFDEINAAPAQGRARGRDVPRGERNPRAHPPAQRGRLRVPRPHSERVLVDDCADVRAHDGHCGAAGGDDDDVHRCGHRGGARGDPQCHEDIERVFPIIGGPRDENRTRSGARAEQLGPLTNFGICIILVG